MVKTAGTHHIVLMKATLILVLAGLAGGICPGYAQSGIGERDQHYRSGPVRPQYDRDRYKPPRVYYPRRMEDVERSAPAPRMERRPPGSPAAPTYGPPPPAIERIPKT